MTALGRSPLAPAVRVVDALASRRRNAWFRLLGVRIEGYAVLRRISIPRQWSDIRIGSSAALDDFVVLLASSEPRDGKLSIGSKTYINRFSMLDAHHRIEIGERCLIGPHCYITDANHGTDPKRDKAGQPMEVAPVIIGDDVWLGAGVRVLSGVEIGDSAVVGAGAVVTKSVAPGARVAGVPAVPI